MNIVTIMSDCNCKYCGSPDHSSREYTKCKNHPKHAEWLQKQKEKEIQKKEKQQEKEIQKKKKQQEREAIEKDRIAARQAIHNAKKAEKERVKLEEESKKRTKREAMKLLKAKLDEKKLIHNMYHKPRFKKRKPISPSSYKRFLQCAVCWLAEKLCIKEKTPSWLLNNATDENLKLDFDKARESETCPYYLKQNNLDGWKPAKYAPDGSKIDIEKFRDSLRHGLKYTFTKSDGNELAGITIGGGLDDLLHNEYTGKYKVIDYKSTSKIESIDGNVFFEYNQIQVAFYNYILKKQGWPMDEDSALFYVNAKKDTGMLNDYTPEKHFATLEFDIQVFRFNNSEVLNEEVFLKNLVKMDKLLRMSQSERRRLNLKHNTKSWVCNIEYYREMVAFDQSNTNNYVPTNDVVYTDLNSHNNSVKVRQNRSSSIDL